MWHPRDHLGIPHLHSTTKRWFLRFGAAPKIAVLHCWSSVYSTLLWGESPFTIVLIVIIPLYPHHSIILSAYLLYQTMVYVILSSLSQRESSQYANNLIWTPRFLMAIYINLAMALHRTWDMLGYVGICWDMLGYVGICWDAGQLWAESPIEHGELPPRSSPVPASCFSGSGFSEDFSGDLRTRRRSQVNVDVVWLVSPLQKGWGYCLLYMIR